MFRRPQTIKNDMLRVGAYTVAYPQESTFCIEMKEKLIRLGKELDRSIEYFESAEEE